MEIKSMNRLSFELRAIRLPYLLEKYKNTKIGLPDFQREWVWTASSVRNLVLSLVSGLPIGAITTTEVDQEQRKKLRLRVRSFDIEVSPDSGNGDTLGDFESKGTVELVLDGQQRLASIFQVFIADRVKVKKERISRKTDPYEYTTWHIDLKEMLSGADGDKFVSWKKTKREKRNQKDTEIKRDFEELKIPVRFLLSPDAGNEWVEEWKRVYESNGGGDEEYVKRVRDLVNELNMALMVYEIPRIVLIGSEIEDRLPDLFSKMNTNMVVLDNFDLLVARYARHCSLREEWKKIKTENMANSTGNVADKMTAKFYEERGRQEEKIDFVRMITLCHKEERRESVFKKDKEFLELPHERFEFWKDKVQNGVRHACRFLLGEKLTEDEAGRRRTQFVILGAIFGYLTNLGRESDEDTIAKVKEWFWQSTLHSRYYGGALGNAGRDFRGVCNWILNGGESPLVDWFNEQGGVENIRSGAAATGILYLLRRNGGGLASFGNAFSAEKDVIRHPICPPRGSPEGEHGSVINLMEMPKSVHSLLSVWVPGDLRGALVSEPKIGEEQIREIFEKNEINSELLKNDDFTGFLEDRKERLIKLVEQATGIERTARVAEPEQSRG